MFIMDVFKSRLFLKTQLDPKAERCDAKAKKAQKPLGYSAVNPSVQHRKEDPANDLRKTVIRAMARSDYWPLCNYVHVNNRAASLHLRLLQSGPHDLEEIRSGLEIALPETKLRVSSD